MTEDDSATLPDPLDSPDAFEGSDVVEPVKLKGEVVSVTGLAAMLGKDRKTILGYVNQGLPIHERGDAATRTAHKIGLGNAWDWFGARQREKGREEVGGGSHSGTNAEEDFDEHKARDKAAQATLRELAVEEAMGRLLDRPTVIRFENERAELFRSQANALHTQVPDLTPEQRDALRAAVNAMLESISVRYVPQHRMPSNDDDVDANGAA
jgi:hypothetical protein